MPFTYEVDVPQVSVLLVKPSGVTQIVKFNTYAIPVAGDVIQFFNPETRQGVEKLLVKERIFFFHEKEGTGTEFKLFFLECEVLK